jgi:hypothetical protein
MSLHKLRRLRSAMATKVGFSSNPDRRTFARKEDLQFGRACQRTKNECSQVCSQGDLSKTTQDNRQTPITHQRKRRLRSPPGTKSNRKQVFPLFLFAGLICVRYLRVQDYDSAVQLLYLGGELLLENGLGASGADITITMIEVYNTAHMKPDSPNRGPYPPLLMALRRSANSTIARNDRSI